MMLFFSNKAIPMDTFNHYYCANNGFAENTVENISDSFVVLLINEVNLSNNGKRLNPTFDIMTFHYQRYILYLSKNNKGLYLSHRAVVVFSLIFSILIELFFFFLQAN